MFHVYWPSLTALALFVGIVIVLVLKYGEEITTNLCGPRRKPVFDRQDAEVEMITYDHRMGLVSEKEFSV